MKNELVTTNIPGAGILLKTHKSRKFGTAIHSEMHYHDEIELLAVTEGELFCIVSGKHYHCQKGNVLFFSARIPHATYVENSACTYTLIQFRPEHFLGDSNNTGKYFKALEFMIRVSSTAESIAPSSIIPTFSGITSLFT